MGPHSVRERRHIDGHDAPDYAKGAGAGEFLVDLAASRSRIALDLRQWGKPALGHHDAAQAVREAAAIDRDQARLHAYRHAEQSHVEGPVGYLHEWRPGESRFARRLSPDSGGTDSGGRSIVRALALPCCLARYSARSARRIRSALSGSPAAALPCCSGDSSEEATPMLTDTMPSATPPSWGT